MHTISAPLAPPPRKKLAFLSLVKSTIPLISQSHLNKSLHFTNTVLIDDPVRPTQLKNPDPLGTFLQKPKDQPCKNYSDTHPQTSKPGYPQL